MSRFFLRRGLALAAAIVTTPVAAETGIPASQAGVQTVPYNAMGEKCGEVTASSAVLHTRLTAVPQGRLGQAIPGAVGRVRFEYATNPQFTGSQLTRWQTTRAEDDFTAKVHLSGLKPLTRYYYRVRISDLAGSRERVGPVRQFKTAPPPDLLAPVRFAAITGQYFGHRDSDAGFFSYQRMLEVGIDFIVLTGDNVYYDRLGRDVPTARMHWHRMYGLPMLVDFFAQVPGYWQKDDHDYRFNDADPYRRFRLPAPTHQQGIKIFLEQHPIESPTYRTRRWGKGLQIWLVEGRDYRSRNTLADGPNKTIWGSQQKAWLKRTLLGSDALFKVLISPTPMVGPDYAKKRDNHVNPRGFRHEGSEFFEWLAANDVKNFFIVCGDRHWRYHSIHPTGYHEFCTGALSDAHMLVYDPARLDGPIPGTRVVYGNDRPVGGFLLVRFEPGDSPARCRLIFEHHTWTGQIEHRATFRYRPTQPEKD
ncbi:MAG: alkaline phosphatase D family protein [Phycisphaerae bacterium]